jgi:RNA polymerase sigma-70 factor (ECF subfamily)
MARPPSYSPVLTGEAVAVEATAADGSARVRALVEEHYDLVWRTLRHLGLNDATAEDGAQQVMCVLARRIHVVVPGAERQFLLSTAVRVASTLRRTARRRAKSSDHSIDKIVAATPSSEELLDERRAHETLARVLDTLPVDLRLVFVLYEIEELTTREIAQIVEVPHGTAVSRLRRAREAFEAIVWRMRAAGGKRGMER